ncbi:hypothetical protein CV657_04635 [Borreliella burgdorferi]|nr:hypothetical protein CV665_04335 [Borreliella burgdorferi]PRR03391.1 hypothetical protein CV669_04680 [Borreliella burgdorferi]PRR07195.1 hypothetical protein CV675_04335 [Borreliella burgdorferi]PRR09648.1 hypothetical protein CV663_04665 [Borreliella burgdorferi]PRR12299.1 hypothetical protein CV658_04335 [Borreliella burgdorferi]
MCSFFIYSTTGPIISLFLRQVLVLSQSKHEHINEHKSNVFPSLVNANLYFFKIYSPFVKM